MVAVEAGQADQVERLAGPAAPLVPGQAAQLAEQLDVGLHAAPRQQGRVLEDVADRVGADPGGAVVAC